MTNSRTAILHRIQQHLGRATLSNEAQAILGQRLMLAPPPIQPQLAADLWSTFMTQLTAAATTYDEVLTDTGVPIAVMRYLRTQRLAAQVVLDRRLAGLAWSIDLLYECRPAQESDKVSVVKAFAGIAETGTLALLSSPHSPTSLNFLPEVQIVVLEKTNIVGYLEDLWRAVRAVGSLPRTVNLITGPSCTGDIEQTLVIGAHGPRQLHVIIVG